MSSILSDHTAKPFRLWPTSRSSAFILLHWDPWEMTLPTWSELHSLPLTLLFTLVWFLSTSFHRSCCSRGHQWFHKCQSQRALFNLMLSSFSVAFSTADSCFRKFSLLSWAPCSFAVVQAVSLAWCDFSSVFLTWVIPTILEDSDLISLSLESFLSQS